MAKFKNPPLNLVTLRLTIPPNLKVSELRSGYFELIKSDFPLIIFPEARSLAFDFSDCHFRNTKNDAQVRISTNYFLYETTNYQEVSAFWEGFSKVFSKFLDFYQIKEVTSFGLNYQNILLANEKAVGEDFRDYFSFKINFKNKSQRSLLTCDGAFIYSTQEGNLKIDIRPRMNQQTKLWDALFFTIELLNEKQIPVDASLGSIKSMFDKAHAHVEDAFLSSLTDKYLKTIQ